MRLTNTQLRTTVRTVLLEYLTKFNELGKRPIPPNCPPDLAEEILELQSQYKEINKKHQDLMIDYRGGIHTSPGAKHYRDRDQDYLSYEDMNPYEKLEYHKEEMEWLVQELQTLFDECESL